MGRTPDRFPGIREEETLYLTGSEDLPVSGGMVTYFTGAIQQRDALGVYDPRIVDSSSHGALRQLIHLADGVGGPFESFGLSTAFRVCGPSPFPTAAIWYTNDSQADKIVEKTIVRNSNQTPNTITWEAYDADGSSVLATVTDSIFYQGIFETHRSRSIT